jgi:hypothetical protein
MQHQYPEYISQNLEFFKKLAKTKSEEKKKKYLSDADCIQILGIVEICWNILKGKVNLNTRIRRKLAQNADYYRKVSRARSEKTARNRIQQGGSVGALAAILAPVLGSLGQYVLDKTILKNETY